MARMPQGGQVRIPRYRPDQNITQLLPAGYSGSGQARLFETAASVFGQAADDAFAVRDKERAIEGELAGVQAARQGDFQPTRGTSAFDQAFDKAGLRVYGARMQAQISEDLERVYQESRDDPSALKLKIDGLRRGYTSGLIPEFAADFEAYFSRHEQAYMRDAGRRAMELLQDNDRAAMLSYLSESEKDIKNLALRGGSPEELAQAYGQMQDALVQYGPRGEFELNGITYAADPTRAGVLEPSQIQQALIAAEQDARELQYFGAFERSGDKAAYVRNFEQRLLAGRLEVDPERGRVVLAQMRAELNHEKQSLGINLSAFRSQLAAVKEGREKGFHVDFDYDAAAAAALASDNADFYAEVQNQRRLDTYSRSLQGMTIDELLAEQQQHLARMREDEAAGRLSGMQVEQFQLLEKRIASKNDLLTDDQTLAATSDGLQPPPIAFPALPADATPEQIDNAVAQFTNSFRERRAFIRGYASMQNVEPVYLSPAERRSFSRVFQDGTAGEKIAMLGALNDGFGRDAPAVLEELNQDDPRMAYLGGLINQGVDPNIVQDVFTGIELEAAGAPVVKATELERAAAFQSLAGPAFINAGGFGGQVARTADALYVAWATRGGVLDAFDVEIYERAFQTAAGQVTRGGRKYGGTADVNGQRTLVPGDIETENFEGWVERLSDRDLMASNNGSLPTDSEGRQFTADDLRGEIYLEPFRDGQYLVNLQPADGPKELLRGNGPQGLFVLDTREIMNRREAFRAVPKLKEGGGEVRDPEEKGAPGTGRQLLPMPLKRGFPDYENMEKGRIYIHPNGTPVRFLGGRELEEATETEAYLRSLEGLDE